MFYNIDSRGQCYKTFLVCDLHIFVLSSTVCRTRLEKLTSDKHSILLRIFVNYRQKSFITLTPGANVIKLFSVRDLQIFVLSPTVSWTRLEKLARDKHSVLLRKFVNYRQKSFITLTPGANVIKLFVSIIY